MADASRDQNFGTSLLGGLNTDGRTLVRVKADPGTHRLKISDGTTGTDHGPTNALRDNNFVTSLIATSSVDGVTPVVVYADSSGNLLVNSM